jgi:hypothetical protein
MSASQAMAISARRSGAKYLRLSTLGTNMAFSQSC